MYGVGCVTLIALSLVVSAEYGAPGSNVKVYEAAAFDKLKDSKVPFLVKFSKDGCPHCVRMTEEYEKTALALADIVKVVVVKDPSVFTKEGVKSFPTIKFYDGTKYTAFNSNRTVTAFSDFVMDEIRSLVKKRTGGDSKSNDKKSGGAVISLSDKDFEKTLKDDSDHAWFVLFYAPWCGHCKAMMGDWTQTAAALKGKVQVAMVDATQNEMLAQHFSIKGFPTVMMFPPLTDRKWNSLPSVAVAYEGQRETQAMTTFGLQYYGKALVVDQLTSQEQFSGECAKGVCLVAFLPHIYDTTAKTRNVLLETLTNVLRASFSMPVKFFWSEGGEQFDLEENLRLQFGFPAVVAINSEKSKYSIHKGAFDEESLRSFITGLMSGRASVMPLPANLPKIKTKTVWDGKDVSPPVENEEL